MTWLKVIYEWYFCFPGNYFVFNFQSPQNGAKIMRIAEPMSIEQETTKETRKSSSWLTKWSVLLPFICFFIRSRNFPTCNIPSPNSVGSCFQGTFFHISPATGAQNLAENGTVKAWLLLLLLFVRGISINDNKYFHKGVYLCLFIG